LRFGRHRWQDAAVDRHARWTRELLARIFDGPANLSPYVRRAAGGDGSLDEPAAEAYVEKVRTTAYAITDADVDGLRSAGWTEDQIFELSIAAAAGAARRHLDAVLAAMAAADARAVAAGPLTELHPVDPSGAPLAGAAEGTA
jgi:hypothetical protein